MLLLVFFTYIFLSEINEVLQVDVVTVRTDVIVDEQIELILNPVLKDKRQDARRQLQEEDDSQEHRELQNTERQHTLNLSAAHCRVQSAGFIMGRTNLRRNVFSRSAPMHPAKPRMNMTPPTTMKSQTGSRPPRSVIDEMLDRTPWRAETEQHSQREIGSCVSFRTQPSRRVAVTSDRSAAAAAMKNEKYSKICF